MLKFETYERDQQMQVDLEGELDIDSTELIQDELLPRILDSKSISISLEKVPFVDSTGIGLLIEMVKQVRDTNGKIIITKVQKDVEEIFELLQIDEILGEDVFSK